MNWDDLWMGTAIGLLMGVVCVLVFAGVQKGRSCQTHSAGLQWPVDAPDTMTMGDVSYAFSPTGGDVHITYKPKEETR